MRSLAYRIKKNRKGHYMLFGLDAKRRLRDRDGAAVALNEDILRFLTLGVNDIEEGPSAILSRKADERDRNFRGPEPVGRFDLGRRRSFGDREEFRAREAPGDETVLDPTPSFATSEEGQ